jgi:hypothetical protein
MRKLHRSNHVTIESRLRAASGNLTECLGTDNSHYPTLTRFHSLALGAWNCSGDHRLICLWRNRFSNHRRQATVYWAGRDVFDYIEMFYNPVRKHTRNGMLSPVDFEEQQTTKNEGV